MDVADIYFMNTYEKNYKLDLFNFIVINLFLFTFFHWDSMCITWGEWITYFYYVSSWMSIFIKMEQLLL